MKKIAGAIAVTAALTVVAPVGMASSAQAAPVNDRTTIPTQTAEPQSPPSRRDVIAPTPTLKKAEVRAHALAVGVPSAWRGAAMLHPSGQRFPKTVARWANLVSIVMAEHKIPAKYLNGILAQIQQESSGMPNSVNLWDSNARRGTPSKGLLQIIAPTYKYYARPGLKPLRYQTQPYANIWAALNYAKKRYGMGKFALWSAGQNQGY